MYGADVAQLRTLARQFDRVADQFDSGRMTVGNAIRISAWVGPFATSFRLQWDSEHSLRIAAAARLLRESSGRARANADDQERTSQDSGCGPAPKPSQDPTLTKDLGDYEPADNISLDPALLNTDQINQGAVGDCWFLAALGAVVDRDPDFIRQHMRQNPDGTWTVTMYRDGEPVEITVEATVPANGAGGPDGEPNWVSIYEKAAAVYFGGDYEDISGDDPARGLAAITGSESSSTGELNLKAIQDRLANGPVVVATEGGRTWWNPFDNEVDNNQIVPGHAYVVDEVREINGQLKIHVLNPWGPDGGYLKDDSERKVGDLWLTEEEYKKNFDSVSSSTRKK